MDTPRRWLARWLPCWCLASAALAVAPAQANPASTQRGRVVFLYGTSSTGRPIQAVPSSGLAVPGRMHPCVQCHRPDGRPGRDGDLAIPGLRWGTLTAPGNTAARGARTRPGYRAADLARAVRDGVDPAGRTLHPAMPRYRIADADLDDLLAYLEVIGETVGPGVDAQRVRIGLLLPDGGFAASIRRMLWAWADAVNREGGIHDRRVELVVRDPGPTEDSALAAALGLAEGPDPVLAVLAPAGRGADPAVLRLLDAAGVPIIAPFSFGALEPEPTRVFRLLPDLPLQGRLVAYALARRGTWAGVVVGPGLSAAQAAQGLRDEALRLSLTLRELPIGSEALRNSLQPVAVFGDATVVAEAMRGRSGETIALLALTDPRALPSGPRPALLAPPIQPQAGHAGLRDLTALLVGTGDLPGSDTRVRADARLIAYAGAKVLEAGLRAAGRELRRDRLVDAIGAIRGLETGVMPAISFGDDQRDGVRAAVVVAASGELVRRSVVDLGPSPLARRPLVAPVVPADRPLVAR